MTTALPLSSRIYGRLLVLYPEELRRDFGAEMALVFADDLQAARREAGLRGALRVWRCALGEFVRLALPACASSPAVRVPAITFALFTTLMTGEMGLAIRHAPHPLSPMAGSAILMLPLYSTPFVSLVSFWACRSNTVISLGLSHAAGKER